VTRFVLALLALLALGCERESARKDVWAAQSQAALDLGAIRVSIVDGLEAAAQDPGIAQQLGLADRFESPEVAAAMSARHGQWLLQLRPEMLQLMLTVEAAYLEAAFAAIERAHGNVSRYLAEVLHVDRVAPR
jgi:hypothetical protein